MLQFIIAALLAIIYFVGKMIANLQDDLNNDLIKLNIKGGSDADDDFVDVDWGTDDKPLEEGPFVAEEEQEYLRRDYTKIIFTRFPLFTANNCPRWWKKPFYKVNGDLKYALTHGDGKHWTNQTLSYMRNRKSFDAIYDIVKQNNIPIKDVVDATANLGGDSISFAQLGSNVKAYEILPNVSEMLKNNVQLYKFTKQITVVPSRFDYNVPKGSFVIIDPPYEKGNNTANFNLSIDTMPIGAVCKKILDSGASNVLISMPKDYKFNMRYANDHGLKVTVYKTTKNVKFYLVR